MLCLRGKSAVEIAEILDIDIHTVSKYIRTFNTGGLEQLLTYKKAPGRPSKLSKPEQELCKEMFCLSPAELDLGVDVNWNSRIMQDFIKDKFGKELHRSTIQRMVAKLSRLSSNWTNLVFKRATKKIKTYGKHAGVGLFGVLDYMNGRVFCDTAELLNTQEFEKFMNEKVLPIYQDKHIYMILDN